jgi:hypothetical protein
MLKQAHEIFSRQELRYAPHRRATIPARRMSLMNFACQALPFVALPSGCLWTGNEAGQRTSLNLPALE